MTAEVIVMNKEAVALAADSAITGPRGRELKIYFSANKIFSLSKYCPVGVMVYSTSSFMGIPWETVIKMVDQFDNLGGANFRSRSHPAHGKPQSSPA